MSDWRYREERTIGGETTTKSSTNDDTVALALSDGNLLFVHGDEESSFSIGDSPLDIAIDTDLYIADENGVRGIGFDGSEKWETPLDGVTSIATLASEDLLVASTETDLIGIDEADGTERFRTARLHSDVSANHEITGGDDLVVVSAWWFLTVIDASGEVVIDTQVDGAIDSIGVTGDVAIAQLQDGRLVGVDLATGKELWEQEIDPDWLAERGHGRLLLSEGDEFSFIRGDGRISSVGTLESGRPEVAASGDPLVLMGGETTTVYRPSSAIAPISGRLLSESVTPGGAIEIDIETRLEQIIEATIEVQSADVKLRVESVTHEFRPGETVTIQFPLAEDWEPGSSPSVRFRGICKDVRVTGRPGPDGKDEEELMNVDLPLELFVNTIPVDDLSERAPSKVESDISIEAFKGSDVTLSLSIQNTGDEDLYDLTIEPNAGVITELPAGHTTTKSVTVPTETNAISITGTGIDTSVDVPELPTLPLDISIEMSPEGFVDVSLQNRSDIPIVDEVEVSGEALYDDHRRSVRIEPRSRFLFSLPPARPTEAGTIQVSTSTVTESSTVDISERPFGFVEDYRLSDENEGLGEPPDSTQRDAPPDLIQDEMSKAETESGEATESGETPDAGGRNVPVEDDPNAPGTAATGDRDGDSENYLNKDSPMAQPDDKSEQSTKADPGSIVEEPDGHASKGTSTVEEDAGESNHVSEKLGRGREPDLSANNSTDRPTEAGIEDESPTSDTPSFRLERSVAAEAFEMGQAIREDLSLNSRKPEEAVVSIDSGPTEKEVQLPSNGELRLRRYHTAYGEIGSSVTLPDISITSENETVESEPIALPLQSSQITPRITLTPQDTGALAVIRIDNDLDHPVRLTSIGFPTGSATVTVNSFTIGASDSRETEVMIPGLSVDEPKLATLDVVTANSGEELRTVASVTSPLNRSLEVTIETIEYLDEGEFNVTLDIANRGEESLAMEIEARGDAPDEYLYSKTEVDHFRPDDSLSHRIECTVDERFVQIPVRLSVTGLNSDEVDGTQRFEDIMTISGILNESAEEWSVKWAGGSDTPQSTTELVSTPILEDSD